MCSFSSRCGRRPFGKKQKPKMYSLLATSEYDGENFFNPGLTASEDENDADDKNPFRPTYRKL